ncbi:transcription intermediary factor 1-alpha, partial [Gadus chalcogrammus]|uniref:transcription intermediary factor 1-alpha n=1 Tax=Gadus chalcogrammus TaxID=1042646 RepID=UPI0024C4B316
MDENSENVDNDDIVIIVENEAESLPAEEERLKQLGANFGLMDTCPICKLSLNNREPKILPCLHSFCKRCLPPPFRTADPRRDPQFQVDHNKPMGAIRCPVCRQECWEMDVLDNFFVKDSAEMPSSTVEKNSQVCMSCDDNTEATGYCVECVEFLCVTCIEAHQRVKFTRDHTIRQKEEMSPEAVGMSTQRPVFCDVHKQEPLKLFCETCDRLTCRDCQLLKHKDHNYQFLEDAYRNHRQYLENMTQQLQQKRKAIEEVSTCISSGLQQVDENRKLVTNEIKKSICSLIMEINRKGKILVNQLETLTKDHEIGLKKQQDEVSSLTRHLDHVIRFTKWATSSHSTTALLYCKRLILFQIHYLMRANCNPSIVPQSSVRFQCRSGFWASNVDLGSLLVERAPGRQPVANPPMPPRGEGSSGSLSAASQQQRQSTLAQLQMQVEKLAQQPNRPPVPNHWSWYQNVRVPGPPQGPPGPPPPTRPIPGGSSPSQMPPSLAQQRSKYGGPHPNPRSPSSSMLHNTGFPPQSLRELIHSSGFPPKPMDTMQGASRYPPTLSSGSATQALLHQRALSDPSFLKRSEPGGAPPSITISIPKPSYSDPSHASAAADRNAQARQISPASKPSSSERGAGTTSWAKPYVSEPATPPASKRRRRASPGPIIIIKDEPEDEDDVHFVQSTVGASLPDSSTGAQSQGPIQPDPPQEQIPTSDPMTGQEEPPRPLEVAVAAVAVAAAAAVAVGGEKRTGPEDDPNEDWCAVCQNGGELLCCDKCPKVYHLACHIPTLHESPSGEWFCSFCRDLVSPEMRYDCDDTAPPTEDPSLPPVDRRKCERLLLRLFVNDFSADFQQAAAPSETRRYKELIKTPMDLSIVKRRLESRSPGDTRYVAPDQFITDVRLIFSNCAKYYKVTSEVGSAGLYLEDYFEEQVKTVYPDTLFPGGREERMIPPLEDEIEEEEEEEEAAEGGAGPVVGADGNAAAPTQLPAGDSGIPPMEEEEEEMMETEERGGRGGATATAAEQKDEGSGTEEKGVSKATGTGGGGALPDAVKQEQNTPEKENPPTVCPEEPPSGGPGESGVPPAPEETPALEDLLAPVDLFAPENQPPPASPGDESASEELGAPEAIGALDNPVAPASPAELQAPEDLPPPEVQQSPASPDPPASGEPEEPAAAAACPEVELPLAPAHSLAAAPESQKVEPAGTAKEEEEE